MSKTGMQSCLIDLNEVIPGVEWVVFKLFDEKPRKVFLTQMEALAWIMRRREDWLYSVEKRATP